MRCFRTLALIGLLAVVPPALARSSGGHSAQPGGWSRVAAPDRDPEVRAAADAMLARIPVEHARLGSIETATRQVVAGMNYRLTVRLADRTRWSAVVWRKPDRTFVVSALAQLK